MLAIEVIDHLVITEDGYTSFVDIGIMDQLKQSGRYELIDKEKGWLQEMKMEAERDKERKEVALKMKKKGYSSDEIKELTGLSKTEINRLKIE